MEGIVHRLFNKVLQEHLRSGLRGGRGEGEEREGEEREGEGSMGGWVGATD